MRSILSLLGLLIVLPLTACDSNDESNDSVFAVNDDQAQVARGQSVVISVLANDTAPDGTDLDLASVNGASCGEVSSFDAETGDVIYQAPASAESCLFDYTASTGQRTASATVTVTVQ